MTDNELLELLLTKLKCLERNQTIRSRYNNPMERDSNEFRQRYTPIKWMRTHWKEDPFSYGVYSHVSKGLTKETSRMIWEDIGKPENEFLWFAGEATESSSMSKKEFSMIIFLFSSPSFFDSSIICSWCMVKWNSCSRRSNSFFI